jgi:hypothetical protein
MSVKDELKEHGFSEGQINLLLSKYSVVPNDMVTFGKHNGKRFDELPASYGCEIRNG